VASAFEPDRNPTEIEAEVRPGLASLHVDRQNSFEMPIPRLPANRRPPDRYGLVRRLQLTALN
jgi:hypothetical protein